MQKRSLYCQLFKKTKCLLMLENVTFTSLLRHQNDSFLFSYKRCHKVTFKSHLSSFQANVPFIYLLQRSENQRFSDVFKDMTFSDMGQRIVNTIFQQIIQKHLPIIWYGSKNCQYDFSANHTEASANYLRWNVLQKSLTATSKFINAKKNLTISHKGLRGIYSMVFSSEKSKKKFFSWLQFIRHKTLHQRCHFMKKINRNHQILKIPIVPIFYSSKI